MPKSKHKKKGVHFNPKSDKVKSPANMQAIVCNDIEKLTFDKFIKCMINNDLKQLIIQGQPSQYELFISWIKILSEYYVLIKSKEQLRYIKLIAKMEGLNLKINVVTAYCEALRLWYEPKMCEVLKKFGFKLQYTAETLISDIDRTMIELGNDKFQLEKARIEYKEDQKKKKKAGEAPTKNTYMKILYAIEKHRQFRYPADKISVYEFGMFYNEVVEYSEAIKEQTESNKPKQRKKK